MRKSSLMLFLILVSALNGFAQGSLNLDQPYEFKVVGAAIINSGTAQDRFRVYYASREYQAEKNRVAVNTLFQPVATSIAPQLLANNITSDPNQRAQFQTLFSNLLQTYKSLLRQKGRPDNDVARATVFFLVNAIEVYKNKGQSLSDQAAFDRWYNHIAISLLAQREFLKLGNRERQNLFETFGIMGMFVKQGFADAVQRNDTQSAQSFLNIARDSIQAILGIPADNLIFTSDKILVKSQNAPIQQAQVSRDVIDAVTNLVYFMFAQASGAKDDAMPDQEFKQAFAKLLLAAYPNLPSETKQAFAAMPAIWNKLRSEWTKLPQLQKEELRLTWGRAIEGNFPQLREINNRRAQYIAALKQPATKQTTANNQTKDPATRLRELQYYQWKMQMIMNDYNFKRNMLLEHHATMMNIIEGIGTRRNWYYVEYK
jgi:hypothetical protein